MQGRVELGGYSGARLLTPLLGTNEQGAEAAAQLKRVL